MRSPSRPMATVLLLIAAVTVARLAYLAWLCPYTLIEDEAHYWEWSRLPALSYYSKGPGIAWIIGASERAFAAAGVELSEFVVRAPAAIAGALVLLFVALLARSAWGERAMLPAVVLALCAPMLQAQSLLMTIDGPYLACWAAAAWFGHVALCGRGRWAWIGLGLAIAAGMLIKHTMLLLVPGLVLAAFALPVGRDLCARWRWWLAGGAAAALMGLVPMLVWNAQHDWPTARHLLGHLGGVGASAGGDMPAHADGAPAWWMRPLWTGELIALQAALLGGTAISCVYGVGWLVRRRKSAVGEPASGAIAQARLWYLVMVAVPMLAFYLLVTLATRAEANWPSAAWISVIALGGAATASALEERAAGARRFLHRVWAMRIAIALGVASGLGMLRLDVLAGVAARVPGLEWVSAGRATGAREYASAVQHELDRLSQATGLDAFFVSQHYGRASQMAFYLPGRPVVYCASSLMGGRRTQYDLWQHTDLRSAAVISHLRGRPAVVLGGSPQTIEQWRHAFETVDLLATMPGEHKRGRTAFAATGFRGF